MPRKFLTIFTAALVIAGSMVQAELIKSISETTAVTSFTGGVGGTLTMGGTGGINVEYKNPTVPVSTYLGGQFGLNTILSSDTSLGGIASGNFSTGSFFYREFGGNVLLSGSINSFNLVETSTNSGMFWGNGFFTVTGGSLQTNFGLSGNMVDITFSVVPNVISNFSSSFLASTNMTVLPTPTPTPEPMTIAFLSLGGLAIFRKKKRG